MRAITGYFTPPGSARTLTPAMSRNALLRSVPKRCAFAPSLRLSKKIFVNHFLVLPFPF